MLKAEQVPKVVAQILLRRPGKWTAEETIAAAINAWPGMLTMPATPDGQWTPWATTSAHIILPLPTEKETSA